MIKRLIQKIRCNLPFSPFTFRHRNVKILRKLSDNSDLIICTDCHRMFAMNHSVLLVLPWEDVEHFYRDVFPMTQSGGQP